MCSIYSKNISMSIEITVVELMSFRITYLSKLKLFHNKKNQLSTKT